ncbi:MAG: hypothetical protein RL095_2276 [Verrucomicrobiota bacterium]|jgi:hypothetical protein
MSPGIHLRPAWHKWVLIFAAALIPALLAGAALRDSPLANSPGLVAGLCLACGCGWLLLLLRLGGFGEWELKGRAALPILALLLGAFSVYLTDLAIGFTERHLPMQSQIDPHSSQPLRNHAEVLAFFTIGVGLREEGLKLLCFLPLAFGLRRHRDRRVILTLASLVGLGFATVENYQYVQAGPVLSGRFLTACVLHMALTGLSGLALHESFRRGGDEAPRVFFGAVAAHGLYDFLIVYPGGKTQDGLGFFAMIVFCLAAMRWLRSFPQCIGNYRLHLAGDTSRRILPWDRISATSLFMAALACSLACDLILRIPSQGFILSVLELYMQIVAWVVLIIFYLREIGGHSA